MFHYLLSDEFESQKNLDADLILFVRRFKLIGLANKSTIPENLLGGSSAQIPVKTIVENTCGWPRNYFSGSELLWTWWKLKMGKST